MKGTQEVSPPCSANEVGAFGGETSKKLRGDFQVKNKITEIPPKGEIIIYQTKDNKIRLKVKLEQETV